jgi:hypothetical protein
LVTLSELIHCSWSALGSAIPLADNQAVDKLFPEMELLTSNPATATPLH